MFKLLLKHIYHNTVPLKWRLGKKYFETFDFLNKAQWWNKEQIETWQLKKLQGIISYAYKNVPGYYRLYKEAGITPRDIRKIQDIKYFPFVSKELIRDNINEFKSTAISEGNLRRVTTGGSTGIPLKFYKTKNELKIEQAFISSIWNEVGYFPGCKAGVLRGATIGTSNKPFLRVKSTFYDSVTMSSYFLMKDKYSLYKKALVNFKPEFIHAYPSSISMLSDLIISKGDSGNFSFVKAILTASETLYDWQYEKIFKAFPSASIFDFYGHTEQVILAAQCSHSKAYHIWPFYGHTEILGKNGKDVDKGEIGELAGTSFWCKATPFIRYRTMDMAKKGQFGCPRCGRQFQLLEKIEGRMQEFIISSQGRYVSMTSLAGNMHSDIFDNVEQFQFYQDKPGEVVLRIVKNKAYTKNDSDKICALMGNVLGEDIHLTLSFLDNIPRTKSGKFRFLVQKLPINISD